jgi:hypothetical protein
VDFAEFLAKVFLLFQMHHHQCLIFLRYAKMVKKSWMLNMPHLVTDDETLLCDTETEVDEKAAFNKNLSLDTSAEFDAKQRLAAPYKENMDDDSENDE